VRFHAEHHFAGPVDAVAERLVDPEFHRHLELPDLSLPEVLDEQTDGTTSRLKLRYQYVGQLDPIAKRLLGGRTLTWIQELELDRATYAGRLSFAAEAEPKQLYGSARFRLEPDGDDDGDDDAGTVRVLDGELFVRVPVVGGMAERRIVPGLLSRLDVEATALDAQLSDDDIDSEDG
jgi:hypothetical protein